MKTKRYLFLGTLVQESSATFGGNKHQDWIDQPLCMDGLGRYTLRGEGQAGALLAMARKLFKTIPKEYFGGSVSHRPSVWRTFTSHPEQSANALAELRQCVRISPQTGAAEDHAMFDLETLPKGVRWPFLLELDLTPVFGKKDLANELLSITVRTLQAWAKGHCWLGGGIARGLGWFTLQQAQVLELNDSDSWPNAFAASPQAYAAQLAKQRAVDLDKFCPSDEETLLKPNNTHWCWLDYKVRLVFDAPKHDDYGTSFLSVGSHSVFDAGSAYPGDKHIFKAAGLNKDNWQPQHAIATSGDQQQPFIPGSSLRGPLRHRLAWWLNRSKAEKEIIAIFNQLFGCMDDSQKTTKTIPATLLMSDAYLANPDWCIAWLHRHAEDEFTAGAYASSLFDRLALFNAHFNGHMVIECRKSDKDNLQKLFEIAQQLAEMGLVPIGGATRHGFGHAKWVFTLSNKSEQENG